MATVPVFRWLPPQAVCAHCARVVPSVVGPAEILSGSLFLAGLAGWLPAAARDLVAAVCADPGAVPVLLDFAEECGEWARVEVEWPRIERHEHVWMAWERGDDERAIRGVAPGDEIWRCTCGVFDREDGDGPLLTFTATDGSGRQVAMTEGAYHRGDPFPDDEDCPEPRCDRGRNHRGDHHAHRADERGNSVHEFWPVADDGPDETEAEDPTTISGAIGYG
jgi:hypothetical protein